MESQIFEHLAVVKVLCISGVTNSHMRNYKCMVLLFWLKLLEVLGVTHVMNSLKLCVVYVFVAVRHCCGSYTSAFACTFVPFVFS